MKAVRDGRGRWMQTPDIDRVRSHLTALGDELWRDGRGWVFLVITVGWFFAIGGRVVFPALIPRVRVALDISLSTAGVVLTLLWLAYALTQFPGGLLGDRIGDRAVLVGSMAVTGLSLAVAATAPGLVAFVAAAVLFGVGSGLFSTTRLAVISDVYPRVASTAIGLNQAAGNVGTSVLPVLAGVVAATALGWRSGFTMLVVPVFLTVGALWMTVPRRTHATPAKEALSMRAVLASVRRPTPLRLTAMMFTMSAVYQGFTSFYPAYLVSEKALSDANGAALFGLFFATGVVVQPLAGLVADAFGPKRTLALTTVATIAGLVVLPFVEGLVGLALVTVLLGTHLGFWPVINSFTISVMPASIQASGFGLIRTGYLVFAAATPAGIGFLADAGLFDEAFVGLGAAALVSLAVGRRLPANG
jgi:MFS family permease